MCNCKDVEIGSYKNQVVLNRPDHMKGREEGSCSNQICVDACIEDEIQLLWALGIITTGCCCGHNKQTGYIGVTSECIPKMKELGYMVYFNPTRPNDEDSFHIRTSFNFNKKSVYKLLDCAADNFYGETEGSALTEEAFKAGAIFALLNMKGL